MSAPDAVHVGFSKCASTFLQSFFKEHPEIFLVEKSHFFAPFELSDYEVSGTKYRTLFQSARAGQMRLESDEHIILPVFHPVLETLATTLEAVSEVARRIKTIQPNAKVIIVIRNQVDLILSRYSEYVLGGGKCSLEDFVSEFLTCSKDGMNYYQNYYSRILDIFRSEFAPANVLMILQEELQRSEAHTIERLCEFLRIAVHRPRHRGVRSRRVGLSRWGTTVMRAFNRVVVRRQARSFIRAEVRVPYILYKVCHGTLRVIDYYLPKAIKGDKSGVLSNALRERIHREFAADNARLATMLSKDLARLGY